MKKLIDKFKAAVGEAEYDDDKLSTCQEKELNKKSPIKNAINEVVEKYGEGVAMTDKILAQLDKNKALVSANIDDMVARNAQLEETLEMTEELVDQTSAFADKASKIKTAMMMKNLKMAICLAVLSVGLIALLLHQMGIF